MLTQQEKDQGYLTRYFCKKGNEYKYIEISKEEFELLSTRDASIAWDLYTPVSIKWGLNSLFSSSNNSQVTNIENRLKWVGFSRYVKPLKGNNSPIPPSSQNKYPLSGK